MRTQPLPLSEPIEQPTHLATVVGITDEPTWPAVIEAFLSDYPNQATRRRYRSDLSILFREATWQHPHQMTAQGIIDYCTAPTTTGKRANNSVRSRIAVVTMFLRYCHQQNISAPHLTTPLRRLQRSHPQILGKVQAKHGANRLSADLLQKLYDACRDGTWQGSRDQVLIRLLALGLRRTEALTLTWGCLRPDHTIVTTGKNGKAREVHPAEHLLDMLARWRRWYEHHIGPTTYDAPLLAHWTGRGNSQPAAGLTVASATRIVKERADLAGLGHLAPHTLRRALAKIMHDTIDQQSGRHNYETTEIAQALGHSMHSLYVTAGAYIGPLGSRPHDAAGKLVD